MRLLVWAAMNSQFCLLVLPSRKVSRWFAAALSIALPMASLSTIQYSKRVAALVLQFSPTMEIHRTVSINPQILRYTKQSAWVEILTAVTVQDWPPNRFRLKRTITDPFIKENS